jgi:hypothetical protein
MDTTSLRQGNSPDWPVNLGPRRTAPLSAGTPEHMIRRRGEHASPRERFTFRRCEHPLLITP